jgi:GrpB-like predicted nucleotidyltransferase (UPF0157 family)
MLGVKRNKVTLAAHNDDWANEYKAAKDELAAILSDNVIEICHIGSTAIKGIAAKPILDIAVVLKDVRMLNIDGMGTAGYEYCGEQGGQGRYLFVRRVDGDISTHHIHCYAENDDNYRSTVLFCGFLNRNPEYAKRYNDLKAELAARYPDDRNAYTDGKADFINMIISLAEATED